MDVSAVCLLAVAVLFAIAVALWSGVPCTSFTLGIVGLLTMALLFRANDDGGDSGPQAELTGTIFIDPNDLEMVKRAERAGIAAKTILLGMLIEDLLQVGCEDLADRATLDRFTIIDVGEGWCTVALSDDEDALTKAAERLGGDWTVTK